MPSQHAPLNVGKRPAYRSLHEHLFRRYGDLPLVERALWEYVVGGAAIFGLIVAVGAWLNGKITRREISRLIVEEHKAAKKAR